jgi:hypothetical protein
MYAGELVHASHPHKKTSALRVATPQALGHSAGDEDAILVLEVTQCNTELNGRGLERPAIDNV